MKTEEFCINLKSGFFIFLIALPLCLGVASASGFPPIAGIVTAIIGGLFSSFLGSAPLSIKGPAAGMIVVVLDAVRELGLGDPVVGYHKTLAVVVFAGIFQILCALLGLGRYVKMVPHIVVQAMMSAIGLVIVSKQIHIILGAQAIAKSPLELLLAIPNSVNNLNPQTLLLGCVVILMLIIYPKVVPRKYKIVPAAFIAILVGSLLGYILGLNQDHLLKMPQAFFAEGIVFPIFSSFSSEVFWKHVVIFTLVGSLESLLTIKGINLLVPENKRGGLDKDLFSVGAGNIMCGLLGGLPMISEVLRSRANIDQKATSVSSNFWHGFFLFFLVESFPDILNQIPLSVLAGLLVFLGFKLFDFNFVVKLAFTRWKDLAVYLTTVAGIMSIDLLVGVALGFVTYSGLNFLSPTVSEYGEGQAPQALKAEKS